MAPAVLRAAAVAPRGMAAAVNVPIARRISESARRGEDPPIHKQMHDSSIVHFKQTNTYTNLSGVVERPEWRNPFGQAVWSAEEVESVAVTHKEPNDFSDQVAYQLVRFMRAAFDALAGFYTGPADENKYLNRIVFLETVAAVPGMVGAMIRHLRSLRRMERDHGWLKTLLEEAENERMHLLTFLRLKEPGPVFRFCVIVTQGVFFNGFFLSYLLSPKTCHRFVGFIEEEAVRTYTKIIEDIDAGKLPLFVDLKAPRIAKNYWALSEDAKFRDLILAVRADEANHREVNHAFADMHAEGREDAFSPFIDGYKPIGSPTDAKQVEAIAEKTAQQ